MKKVVIGIDIGGTNTKFGIVDKAGNILAKGSIPTTTHERVEDYLSELYDAIGAKMANLIPPVDLMGIGLGAPNGNYYNGTIEFAPNLRWKGVLQITEMIEEYYQLPVVLTNDANAAAIGEMLYGNAQGMNNFIVVTLGTGVGSGIVVNGEILYGHDGFAGEMGHVTVIREGRMCTCGRKGCLEEYASARGIVKTVIELMENTTTPSQLRQIAKEDLTPKYVAMAAKQGDTIAIQAFNYAGQILGRELANAVAYTSPEAIFVFGGVARAGEFILEPTQEAMESNLLNIYKNKIQVLPSGLKESNVAILGASALIWKELNSIMQKVNGVKVK